MNKTITELSKELGVTRQAVHQALDKLIDKKKLKKKGNAFILGKPEQAKLQDYFKTNVSSEPSSNTSINTNELTKILQQQNEFLIKEIENKNKQINELHILLLKEKETKRLLDDKSEEKTNKEPWYRRFKR